MRNNRNLSVGWLARMCNCDFHFPECFVCGHSHTSSRGFSDNCAADLRGGNRTCATVGTRSPREDERFLRRCGGIVPWSWTVVRVLQIKSGGYPKVSRSAPTKFSAARVPESSGARPTRVVCDTAMPQKKLLTGSAARPQPIASCLRAACQSFSTNSNVEAGKSLRSAAAPQPNCSRALRGPPTS